jgi:hypothetical protein
MMMMWIAMAWEFCDEDGCVLEKGHSGDHRYAKGTSGN